MTRVVLSARDEAHARALREIVVADGWACSVRHDPETDEWSVMIPVSNADQADTVTSALSLVVPVDQSMRVIPALAHLR